jgi:hypothetical protein
MMLEAGTSVMSILPHGRTNLTSRLEKSAVGIAPLPKTSLDHLHDPESTPMVDERREFS